MNIKRTYSEDELYDSWASVHTAIGYEIFCVICDMDEPGVFDELSDTLVERSLQYYRKKSNESCFIINGKEVDFITDVYDIDPELHKSTIITELKKDYDLKFNSGKPYDYFNQGFY
jgi:hypothetical protein